MTDEPWNRTKIVHSPFLKQYFFIGISFWCTPPPLPALPIRQCDPLHSHIPGKPQHYKCFNVPPPSTCFRIKRRKELGTPSKQYNLLINEWNQRYFSAASLAFKKERHPYFCNCVSSSMAQINILSLSRVSHASKAFRGPFIGQKKEEGIYQLHFLQCRAHLKK